MIKIVEGFPESVVGFIAEGRVTRQDYTEVLIPAVEAALHKRERIRCYYEFGPDFAGFDAALGGRTGWCRAPVALGTSRRRYRCGMDQAYGTTFQLFDAWHDETHFPI